MYPGPITCRGRGAPVQQDRRRGDSSRTTSWCDRLIAARRLRRGQRPASRWMFSYLLVGGHHDGGPLRARRAWHRHRLQGHGGGELRAWRAVHGRRVPRLHAARHGRHALPSVAPRSRSPRASSSASLTERVAYRPLMKHEPDRRARRHHRRLVRPQGHRPRAYGAARVTICPFRRSSPPSPSSSATS